MNAVGASTRPRRRLSPFVVTMTALTVVVALFVVYPIGVMVYRALFEGGVFNADLIAVTFEGSGFWAAARNTLIITLAANVIAITIGTLFAWLNERTDAGLGALSTLLPIIPLLMPPVAMTIGWLFLADKRAGFLTAALNSLAEATGIRLPTPDISNWGGLIFVYSLFLVPHVYVVVGAAFRSLDPSLEEAARVAGRGNLQTFLRVSVPAIRHAIGSSVLLVTIACIGLYSIAAILGTPSQIPVLSVYLRRLLHGQYPPATGQAVVIGLALVIVLSLLWLAERRIAARGRHAQIGGMGIRPNRVALGPWKHVARAVMIGYIVATSVLPLLALLTVSLQPFWNPAVDPASLSLDGFVRSLTTPSSVRAIGNSTMLGIVAATTVVLLAGVLTVFAKDVGGVREKVIGTVLRSPSAISNLIYAIGLLVAVGAAPFFLNGTLWILFIAYVVTHLPQAAIAAESSIRQVGAQLTEAARIFGAGPGRTFARIVLPLIASGLAAGWALVFAITVGDLSAAAILSGPRNPVIGYEILYLFDNGTYANLAALGVVITVISSVSVGLTLILARPRFSRRAGGVRIRATVAS